MKWIGINNMGCTWEPKEHFVGADTAEKLKEYICYTPDVNFARMHTRRLVCIQVFLKNFIYTGRVFL